MTDTGKYQAAVARTIRALPIRGVEYSVNEWGDTDAPLIFYLHGWADTGSTLQFVVDAMTGGWRVVAPDWRGFGRTGHCAAGYWFPDYLADLHALLEHYSPNDPVALVGHSMGGNIVSLYAGAMPERVRALINIEGFGLPNSDPLDAPGRFRNWIESGGRSQTFSNYRGFESLARKIRKRSPGISEAQADFVARQWAQELRDGCVGLRADPTHKLPNPILYRRAEAEACWAQIDAATLLVYGDQSPYAGPSGSPASLPFPNSEIFGVAGVGHMIHFEAPQVLAERIEQFLQQTL